MAAPVANYFPILIFAVLAAALPLGTIFVARAIQTPPAQRRQARALRVAASSRRRVAFDTRFSVRYFLIAVLFVVFDVETIFLFPWAIMFHKLGLFGLIEMLDLPGRSCRRVRLRLEAQGPGLGLSAIADAKENAWAWSTTASKTTS